MTEVNITNTQQKRLPLTALFSANAISMIGNQMAIVAIPWFVLQTTGSAGKTGLTAFFTILPVVLAAFFGGSLVDKLGFKPMSIIADCASTVAIAAIPLLYATTRLEFWQLLILVFIGNMLDAPGTTARDAMTPDLAGQAQMSLERATTSMQVIERSSHLIGAPIAGVLIAIIGPSQVLWVDAATFAISAVLVALFVPHLEIQHPETTISRKNFVGELLAGFHFIWQDRLMRLIVGVVMITNLLDAALIGVILPVFIKNFFGQALDLGLFISVSGAASVIGAIGFGLFGKKWSRRAIFCFGFVLMGMQFIILAAIPPFWLLLILTLICGIGAGPLNPIIGTIEFERVPAEVRGRVFGAVTAGVNIGSPLGVLLAGGLLELVPIQILLIVMGAIYIAVTGISFFTKAIREMDK